ncbi:thioredoxin-like protein, putative [Plasmodium malariae]|uniref:Thioredoxin-like protein, putative n=1 Tax=Plasmodium malariae TaxID=5858 RepID=A0A1C3KDD6_PLAMA|nr:thioredoxin-like protein, putative [Plasmodium malariae]
MFIYTLIYAYRCSSEFLPLLRGLKLYNVTKYGVSKNNHVFHFIQKNKLVGGCRRKKNSFLFFLNLKKKKLPHLLCFHSEDCEYCRSMEKLLTKLKEEEDVNLLKLEMYENSYNFELLQQLDYNNLCGGLPYYYNLKTHYNICGATTYHNLRNWALDRKCNPNEPPNEEI